MYKIKIIAISWLVLFLSGCSYIYGNNGVIINRNTDYLKARSIPPLKIPPGISSSTIHAEYPVPERSYPGSMTRPDLTPPYLNETALDLRSQIKDNPRA
jgi:uncharacterized lipoprotein